MNVRIFIGLGRDARLREHYSDHDLYINFIFGYVRLFLLFGLVGGCVEVVVSLFDGLYSLWFFWLYDYLVVGIGYPNEYLLIVS